MSSSPITTFSLFSPSARSDKGSYFSTEQLFFQSWQNNPNINTWKREVYLPVQHLVQTDTDFCASTYAQGTQFPAPGQELGSACCTVRRSFSNGDPWFRDHSVDWQNYSGTTCLLAWLINWLTDWLRVSLFKTEISCLGSPSAGIIVVNIPSGLLLS